MSDWYYADNNEQRGPVIESELKDMLATNKLPAEALVWKEGMANWTPASQVPALASLTSTAVASATTTPNPDSVTPVTASDILGTPEALEVDPDDAEKNKIFGIIAYLGILCFVPLLAAKNSPFAKYHSNQGIVLFIFWFAILIGVRVINGILGFILPNSLGFIYFLISLVEILPMILTVLGIINASQGKCVPLPVIGGVKLIK
jgi:uncharacterized membrane protein